MNAERALERAFAGIEGLAEGESVFVTGRGWWVHGREVAHVHDDVVEIRLTRPVIRDLREELRTDPRVELRRSGSDWLGLRVGSAADVARARELMSLAVRQHLPPPGVSLRPPPAGAELARRRRFH